MIKIIRFSRFFFNIWYRFFPAEMVTYWERGDRARAKLVVLDDGSYAMLIEGEKYPLYGFPRGPVLFGPVAVLKHLAKNLIFNQSWKFLEEGKSNEEIISYIKKVAIPVLRKEIEKCKYDMFPPERMCPAIRELHRALTSIGLDPTLRDGITFFFGEDDAYKFRLQFATQLINPKHWLRRIWYFGRKYSFRKELETAFYWLEHAEIVPDMKGRIKLIKRILFLLLEDKEFGLLIDKLVKELDWKKLYLSRADRYYFRGKYYRPDILKYDY